MANKNKSKIEIPQFNIQMQDLNRPFQITDNVGNMFQFSFAPNGGLNVTKLSELGYRIEIEIHATNVIEIK
jgi:hypothetical protein